MYGRIRAMEEFEPVQPADPNDPRLGVSSMPHLPPSSLEVRVRTMKDDIESIGKGGGLLGIAEKISLSIPREGVAPGINSPITPSVEPKSKTGTYIFLGIGAALILFAVGYFLPQILSKNNNQNAPAGSATTTTPKEKTPAPAQANQLIHKSFFASPADMILPFSPTASTSLTFKEQWHDAFKLATGTITEAQFQNGAKEYLGFSDFLSALGIQFSSVTAFQLGFEKDFTAFVYKDSAGLWPGYILKLKSEVNALLVRGDIAKLELERDFILSSFALPPGTSDASFKDSQLSGLPVRELTFSLKPAQFIYGLTQQGYLVIAASEDAFKTALARL